MDSDTAFFDCPVYVGGDGTSRCGLPAAVEYRYKFGSADGPLTRVKIRCPQGHRFSGLVEALTMHAASAPVSRTAGGDSSHRSYLIVQ